MSNDHQEFFQCEFSPQDFDNKFDIIINKLREQGIIFIKGIFSNIDARNIANKLGVIMSNIDANDLGITEISNQRVGNNKKNSRGFTNKKLRLHTDRSTLENPPNLVMNWMCYKNCAGGQAMLADGYKIFEEIKLQYKDIISTLIDPEIACFTDGIKCFTGAIFYINHDSKLCVRFRDDQCSYFKLKSKRAIKIFQKIAMELAHTINFDVGSGYIINNNRWLHGRTHFEGLRIIRRIHIIGEF